jgi:NAD(P)-dependent dehydrogenase (short-subunit alcohol dehydrogenase family)
VIRCMAVEFGKHNIRANVVAPGLIMTPMMGGEANEKALSDMMGPRVPIQRVGQVDDFEGIGAFLCSDASSFITGETINVDGGYMIRP